MSVSVVAGPRNQRYLHPRSLGAGVLVCEVEEGCKLRPRRRGRAGGHLWGRVKDRQRDSRSRVITKDKGIRSERARRPNYLLSGLLKCGTCGGGFSAVPLSALPLFTGPCSEKTQTDASQTLR